MLENFYSLKFDQKTNILTVFVKREDGKYRKIEVKHHSKTESHLPPKSWVSQIEGEIEYQKTEEANEKLGRKLPF